ncbi:histidine--tRNA ligase [Candidatus Roizmanbacteria bacterium CG22_combo_CG10-13_8_21_14_all_35_9]|uniref:Histidine--tRNA ligase n=3 Tax=Candidatus Roizmaniibacteriota TaxID=1752723 RepID=A0A2M8F207_9BACT|nr:MAG: histidine--tRNA ligase [Candidatus Roizmanbacteria bacterium CG23_combo_of_CG06-09_8_20_14_all_35_49]PIP62257.1 MAG: histidine--tRNA ligase [Candidatus Roizmanbacteria bacterium CG22_combo_CG10-13_8_21_14_all_35_9]PJC33323.1 MAG: histidine--tRNA ligase [Candidatus Roizmanbacteria bacterium CG_4_9_14_0_2_um_filter_35_15]PJC82946.1 MAG: histidine--tRNA ligase [Candidatus Roizmanbacteria bacterium CG_4_8_14_3_um_filter_35_14]
MDTKIKPQILKGFRDFLPEEALKRQYVIDIIRKVFELYGYEPIETPAIEYLEVFTGNIGEDEKLFYKFEDAGGRKVALRYDQTVPTCRFIAQYQDKITLPFKRYQIATVWRAEKPQAGRYREFLQCDADIFGVEDRLADAETIALTIDIFKALGFNKPIAIINDRDLYKDIPYKAIVSIDKLEKIGKEEVINELIKKGYQKEEAIKLLEEVALVKPNKNLKTIFSYLDQYGMKENYLFKPALARSFSYSNGTIWEIIVEEFKQGSLAGCERYDSLVSRFSKRSIPGVGFAIGFDRTVLAMDQFGLFPVLKTKTRVLVTVFDKALTNQSLTIAQLLRNKKVNTDLYPDPNDRLDKQLKYADKKGIPYVIIIGPEEASKNIVKVKEMKTGEQKELTTEEVLKQLNIKT